VTKEFGYTSEGLIIYEYTLKNDSGVSVSIINYGGIITSIRAPDSNGKEGDIVLGFDNLDGYLKGHPYFGALIGRHGNRIAKGKFKLDDLEFNLATNNGPNHLHGGIKGFDKVVWNVEVQEDKLILTYLSKDGEEGYPGDLLVSVEYSLSSNELHIKYVATTNKPTVVNLTNHSYFNLAGEGDILNHHVQIEADGFTPIDETLIPTGEITPVSGTPFDFTSPKAIGERIEVDHIQLKYGKGYDHNFVVRKSNSDLNFVARVTEPNSKRVLEVYSSQPGVQFYTGNFLDGSLTGKNGKIYHFRNGFCLETQHFPDTPNQPSFPTTLLLPNQTFNSHTVYKFTIAK